MIMEDKGFYWFWLCNIPGIGRAKQRSLIKKFGSAQKVFEADVYTLSEAVSISRRDVSNIIAAAKDSKIYENFMKLKENNINWVHIEHPDYPQRLKNVVDAPLGLYCMGCLPCDEWPSAAVVGARGCTFYGRKMAFELARSFAEMGIQVVSGLASGIDAAAHRGSLEAKGYTCGVLGCGTDICYPADNADIYNKMLVSGGVISEYAPGTPPDAWRFPERNRIISALSDVVIVVEAASRSGALITADQALEQNRDVMAVPGRADDRMSEGCNKLIKDGAMMITTPEDIMQCSPVSRLLLKNKEIHNKNFFTENINSENTASCSELQDRNLLASKKNMVYSVLGLHPKNTDEIISETGFDISTVTEELLMLQLEGYIEEVSKNCYIRIK